MPYPKSMSPTVVDLLTSYTMVHGASAKKQQAQPSVLNAYYSFASAHGARACVRQRGCRLREEVRIDNVLSDRTSLSMESDLVSCSNQVCLEDMRSAYAGGHLRNHAVSTVGLLLLLCYCYDGCYDSNYWMFCTSQDNLYHQNIFEHPPDLRQSLISQLLSICHAAQTGMGMKRPGVSA